ncbi:unnamed protein product [Acanthoscelides obtectus]|uniref:Uncharacterized protein n=1 Tax=Acanthoscelides obtectus TaxID=200917 RepID=A0A9P0LKI9_ACAOB|nr:unnamed protein product [Acanthoscelides obtectus]CAK1658410.1 hypothetical protein AOBTE_LOCUS20869 [Acanthoscelides obtectus]
MLGFYIGELMLRREILKTLGLANFRIELGETLCKIGINSTFSAGLWIVPETYWHGLPTWAQSTQCIESTNGSGGYIQSSRHFKKACLLSSNTTREKCYN